MALLPIIAPALGPQAIEPWAASQAPNVEVKIGIRLHSAARAGSLFPTVESLRRDARSQYSVTQIR
jgi:hypothetical protein